jgi:hypothetical protein
MMLDDKHAVICGLAGVAIVDAVDSPAASPRSRSWATWRPSSPVC